MKIYFAGTGSLQKQDILKTGKLCRKRLLSYAYILKGKPQYRIFKMIKNEKII
jgi:hypothetical protein